MSTKYPVSMNISVHDIQSVLIFRYKIVSSKDIPVQDCQTIRIFKNIRNSKKKFTKKYQNSKKHFSKKHQNSKTSFSKVFQKQYRQVLDQRGFEVNAFLRAEGDGVHAHPHAQHHGRVDVRKTAGVFQHLQQYKIIQSVRVFRYK